jgi:hypothetical protein
VQRAIGELGVERGGGDVPVADEDRLTRVAIENFGRACVADARCPNEHQRATGLRRRFEAVDLAAPGIAPDHDVEARERPLRWILDGRREQDQPCARGENRMAPPYEGEERRFEAEAVDHLELDGALASWKDEPVEMFEVRGGTNLDDAMPLPREHSCMRGECALNRKHADGSHLTPRVRRTAS